MKAIPLAVLACALSSGSVGCADRADEVSKFDPDSRRTDGRGNTTNRTYHDDLYRDQTDVNRTMGRNDPSYPEEGLIRPSEPHQDPSLARDPDLEKSRDRSR